METWQIKEDFFSKVDRSLAGSCKVSHLIKVNRDSIWVRFANWGLTDSEIDHWTFSNEILTTVAVIDPNMRTNLRWANSLTSKISCWKPQQLYNTLSLPSINWSFAFLPGSRVLQNWIITDLTDILLLHFSAATFPFRFLRYFLFIPRLWDSSTKYDAWNREKNKLSVYAFVAFSFYSARKYHGAFFFSARNSFFARNGRKTISWLRTKRLASSHLW